MPSLFRIDSNSLTADNMKPSSVVELPKFEEMVERNGGDPSPMPISAGASPDADAPPRSAEGEVLVRKKYELQQLQQQIKDAQGQAQEILSHAEAQAKQIIADAQQKGYGDGFAQASASVREEQTRDSRLIEEAVVSLKNARDEVFSQIESSVLDLSLYIAEHIIKIKLNENDEAFINIVRSTLSKVKYQNNIIVNVSKEEYERLFADPSSEIVQEMANSGVIVKQDMSLKSGECMVETEFGNINSGIKTQLKRLGYALEEGASD